LRLPVFLSGIAVLVLTTVVGERLYSREAGIVAAAWVAAALPVVMFSVNARGYMVQTLLMLVMLLSAITLARQPHPPRWLWAVYGLLAALSFWVLPTSLYPVGVVSLWLGLMIVLEPERRMSKLGALLLSLGVGALLTVLVYIPPIRAYPQVLGMGLSPDVSFIVYLSERLPAIVRDLWVYLNQGLVIPVQVVWLAGLAIGLVVHRRVSQDRVSLGWAMVLWLMLALTLQRVEPFMRAWVYLLPLLALVAGAGLTLIPGLRLAVVGLAVMFSVVQGAILLRTGAVATTTETGYVQGAAQVVNHYRDVANPVVDDILTPNKAEATLQTYFETYHVEPVPEFRFMLYDEDGRQLTAGEKQIFTFREGGWTIEALLASHPELAAYDLDLVTVGQYGDWTFQQIVPLPR
jgi:hypothetical protein